MLGFGKKKDREKISQKDEPDGRVNEQTGPRPDSQSPDNKTDKTKKKFSKKKIIVILVVLICLGASSFLVYTLYFAQKTPGPGNGVYEKKTFAYLKLPEEMVKFCFEHFPDLYTSMIGYEFEMTLFDREISRIDAIGQKYPDQKKIAQKEKKIWEKAKNTLEKSFLKIEKSVRAIYVLFQVNKEQGLVQIQDQTRELTQLAQNALTLAREQTGKLNINEDVPKGFIKKSVYKLKKKFL